MPEGRKLINVLKSQGTSMVIQRLTPDSTVPNLNAAINLVENYLPTHEKRYNSFHLPRQVNEGSHFTFNTPMKRNHYKLLIISELALNDLNLSLDNNTNNNNNTVKILSGQKVFISNTLKIFPYSLAYAGFQFGQFAGQLGDGRLVNLFDIKDRMGHLQTLQIKGSGLTPFSRFGDGKSILRSSIREFIISEFLYHTGVPSTRALQLTLLPTTTALRDGRLEPCAIVCRFAPCWIRIGNFDLFRMRPNLKGLLSLTDFCIDSLFNNGSHFPNDIDINCFQKNYFPIETQQDEPILLHPVQGTTKYDLFYRQVVRLNASCVAYWQSYGFLNGVLNTDNTSIMGLSMDFGPFNFLDQFQPDFTPNHDDSMKRYSFQNQPDMIWWNLVQLGHSLAILIGAGSQNLNKILELGYTGITPALERQLIQRANCIIKCCSNEYNFVFTTQYTDIMAKRLGVDLLLNLDTLGTTEQFERTAVVVQEFGDSIIEPLLNILQKVKIDYNNFFVNLQNFKGEIPNLKGSVLGEFDKFQNDYLKIFFTDDQVSILQNRRHNNNDEISDVENFEENRFLFETLKDIIDWTDSYSRSIITDNKERIKIAQRKNPIFLPRSWILDEVIEDLTIRQRDKLHDPDSILDTSLLEKILLMSSYPYDPTKWNPSLRPDKEKEWTDLQHSPEKRARTMKQSTCSS